MAHRFQNMGSEQEHGASKHHQRKATGTNNIRSVAAARYNDAI